jgi:phage tail-like protein
MSRVDPVIACNFTVTLTDTTTSLGAVTKIFLSSVASYPIAGFSECSGLENSLDVQEYMEGGRNDAVLKFPTRFKPANIVLKKGLTSGTDLWDWFNAFLQGVGRRRDGMIAVHDGAGNTVATWGFRRGIPMKYSGPQLVAAQSNVAIETLEIAHEGLYLVGGSASLAQKISQAANAIAGLAD